MAAYLVSTSRRLYVWMFLLLLSLVGVTYTAPAPTLPAAASFYVPTLPGLTQDPNHPIHIYAGHLPSDPKNPVPTPEHKVVEHLYFVLLKARWTSDKERVVLWFNGGPGCSSFDGLMMEVGPWRVDGKGGLKAIDGGWDEYAHVVYIDQPAGTGFSYASTDSYLQELDEMATHVVQFLHNFYTVFPELASLDTYLAGESFAGQYIPYIADAILKTTTLQAPLKGLVIGNGWIDGKHQYPAYYEFAIKSEIIKEDSKAASEAREVLKHCKEKITSLQDSPVNIGECEGLMGKITEGLQQSINGKMMCLNMYDIRLSDEYPACGMNWPPDLSAVTDYLRRSDVVNDLHARDKAESWTECSGPVFSQFSVAKSQSSITLFPSLLEKVPIMLFAGDQDYICNYVGIERLIEGLEWGGHSGFGDAKVLQWKVNNTDAGTWQAARNLTYVRVAGASHMVGFDVPNVAHDMILRFMGVDFSALAGGSSPKITSSLGDKVKPNATIVPTGIESKGSKAPPEPTPTGLTEQDKARWEAYYNAGSAALILLIIVLAVGLFFYFRMRKDSKKKPGVSLPTSADDGDEEETIPLQQSARADDEDDMGRRRWKGKGRAREGGYGKIEDGSGEPMFDVGDLSDDEKEGRR